MSKEKQKKKDRKKRGKKGGIILFLILLIALILVILYFFGGSFGLGSGNGGTVPAGGTVSNNTEQETDDVEETPAETKYIDVTVSEDKYLYSNDTITIDELIEKVNGFEEKCEVHITVSETATLNAVDDLKAAFDSNGIEYMVIEASE